MTQQGNPYSVDTTGNPENPSVYHDETPSNPLGSSFNRMIGSNQYKIDSDLVKRLSNIRKGKGIFVRDQTSGRDSSDDGGDE